MFDHFTVVAPIYERVIGFLSSEQLREYARLPVAGPLLDAGGGTGRVAQALRGMAEPIVVTDISRGMLEQAAGKDGLRAVRAHAERLPFPDGAFARIIVVDAFHHFCDQREAVADLWRVLAPGGRLVIEEPNIATLAVKAVALAERIALMRSRFFSPGDMAQMVRALGGETAVYADHAFNSWVVGDKGQS